ncbi:DUF4142 domain-containing protein [Bdellovibrio sp. HCB185ZH]|uniref:DUF4142 domain-containing protein n=1 Tax=Bdellovibrio sp. HCB185ZH TaxID=3394235 RepID=UPI0039A75CC6
MRNYHISVIAVVSVLLFTINCFALEDAQITQLMKTANSGEVDAAKLAVKNSKNPSVKTFAEKMVKEHTENGEKVKTLSKDEKIKMSSSDDEKKLKADTKEKMKGLKKAKENDFDKAYMGTQVAMHQELLDKLDTKLIPEARNPALKSYLQETRAHVQNHLNDAKTIQNELQ